MTKINTPPAFHVMAKPSGATCNLDCKYCFFLTKEALYPDSNFRMQPDVQRQYIRQYIQSQQIPEVQLAWQGGEPTLMGLDFYKQSVKIANQYKKFGMRVNHAIQTNGILLDDEWCQFLHENNFLVGLSMDGPRDIHDTYRVDKGGKPTFERVMHAAELLKKHRVDFNILCTVHAANGDRPLEVYRFFRDEVEATFIQFIPIIERLNQATIPIGNVGTYSEEVMKNLEKNKKRPLYTQTGSQVTERSIRPDQYGKFLIEIFDEWVRRDVGKVFVQMFDVALANWVGAPPGLCIHSETCGNALALEHTGDLYSCDHFVEPEFFLGNIKNTNMDKLVGSEKQRKFGADKRDTLPKYCVECSVRFACHGGCPKDRFTLTPKGEPGLNYLCEGYKAFFNHIDPAMRFMADEIQHRRPAANIMDHLRESKL